MMLRRVNRLRALAETIRGNLFLIPAVLLLVAILLAALTTWIDSQLREAGVEPSPFLVTTVDGARAVLGTVASATIAFAGVSISISLLLIQLASSQFSPRVLHGFFRDPFTKWVTGIVIGTFAYCLLTLRVVRVAPGDGGVALVPHISVLVATVLGITSIVAVVALINHSARSMQVGEIIRRITTEGHQQIERLSVDQGSALTESSTVAPTDGGSDPGLVAEAGDDGWVQAIDPDAILTAIPADTVVTLSAFVGGFSARGAALGAVRPVPADPEPVLQAIRRAVLLGRSRTTQQDVGFAFRQLVDIALRALSPGINDPTTAQESLVHIGSLLRGLLSRDLPPAVIEGLQGRRLERPRDPTHDDFVNVAFDQIRVAGARHPSVCIALLEVIGDLVAELERSENRNGLAALRRQARLVIATVEASDALTEDKGRVREVARVRGLVTFA